jgi:hypothetical protein
VNKIRRRNAVGLLTMLHDEAFFCRLLQDGTDFVSAKHWAARARKYRKWASWVKAVLDSGVAS